MGASLLPEGMEGVVAGWVSWGRAVSEPAEQQEPQQRLRSTVSNRGRVRVGMVALGVGVDGGSRPLQTQLEVVAWVGSFRGLCSWVGKAEGDAPYMLGREDLGVFRRDALGKAVGHGVVVGVEIVMDEDEDIGGVEIAPGR